MLGFNSYFSFRFPFYSFIEMMKWDLESSVSTSHYVPYFFEEMC